MGLYEQILPEIGGKSLKFSTGNLASQANGSVVVSYSDTIVLVTACISEGPQESFGGFIPLVVDYQERTYAMGKIPGGFIKREGRPKDTEILSSRLIDRSIRPFFPKNFAYPVQIIVMVLSSDGEYEPDILGVNGASLALLLSDIPYNNAVGAVRVAKKDNDFIINPTYEEREKSTIDMVVAATEEKVIMLEGRFREAQEKEILEAIKFSHPVIKKIIEMQKEFQKKCGKEKREITLYGVDGKIFACAEGKILPRLEDLYILDKKKRSQVQKEILNNLYEEISRENEKISLEDLKFVFSQIERKYVRKKILEEKRRPDSRGLEEIREIECEVSVLPRTHGSALFRRGQTQALATTTLGTSSDEQLIEALEGEKTKRFMLHYTFPPFSVGEIKPLRGPSRREIGHGALAERALESVIPSKEEFPYTIRVVSEILESNGSSSMATVCAASLALMDAGVPIKKPVAGVALGLVKENSSYVILTDIAGLEDAYGDMDFKVAGTSSGITAIQLDLKIDGLEYGIIEEVLERAEKARTEILKKMNLALSLPRKAISKYAPKIKSFKIDLDKIGEVIGPGGKTIRKIIRQYNVTVDIDDETGQISVVAETEKDLENAVDTILKITQDIRVGEIYSVKITRITNFGAFCEIFPGKIGLIHISEVSHKFVKNIRDFIKEGEIVQAKVINIDPAGRITLSIKQVS
ncbi:MAG: polyribonucleotide nucleotidyltransferase [Candidatus Omnitrophica bacterium 4484_70.2]|nr:MAG: polyribonucleotide nucleotidyltransferase [Candidatus Omnitrophica bacterium 4484_70.2]